MSLLRLMRNDISRRCPFYTRGAKCTSGCWSEPYCVTGQPLRGWPWERLLARVRVIGWCSGVLSIMDGQADCGRTDHRHNPHTYVEDES